ncbi:prepilin peptidase [Herbiconiux sp.]|uniref:prepilin peptidase n=1 Tax=Herbiconiux sp. TaxID=1871186 RepID=UPI0025C13468|nr:prepilin peptidase [Herbiconiux sp.]
MLLQLGYLAVVTVPLVVIDVRSLRLPNALVLPGLLLLVWGLLWAALAGQLRPVTAASSAPAGVVGALLAGGLLLGGWMLGAVGMGDVKLGTWLGGLAGMMGVPERPEALGQGAAAGGIVVAVLFGAELAARAPPALLRIPFGPALLAAFWASSVNAR